MNAYNELYLEDAMRNLGEGLDYAVNACHISANRAAELFIVSGIADRFGKGNPRYVSGLSGTELMLEIFAEVGLDFERMEPQIAYDCSPEYWGGWALAYYQWKSGMPFKEIFANISMEEIIKFYPVMHEASEDKFADTLNAVIRRKKSASRLQQQRKICGYTQRELAGKAGVNLRTLQQYECGLKEIRRASAQTVLSLAQVLGCGIEDLFEWETR